MLLIYDRCMERAKGRVCIPGWTKILSALNKTKHFVYTQEKALCCILNKNHANVEYVVCRKLQIYPFRPKYEYGYGRDHYI